MIPDTATNEMTLFYNSAESNNDMITWHLSGCCPRNHRGLWWPRFGHRWLASKNFTNEEYLNYIKITFILKFAVHENNLSMNRYLHSLLYVGESKKGPWTVHI